MWKGELDSPRVASNELQVNNCRRHKRQAMDSSPLVGQGLKTEAIESFRQLKQLMRLR